MSHLDPALLAKRLFERDLTLWPQPNVASTRLGWLDAPQVFSARLGELDAVLPQLRDEHVVLIGMGGSSLAPEVMRSVTGASSLTVIDSTHPDVVDSVNWDDASVLVSSKSGSTIEVGSLLAYAWSRIGDGSRFMAITDPNTPLASLAAEREFRSVFYNPADVGGRYSALTWFGLLSAAICGIDVHELLNRASRVDIESACELGIEIGEEALAGQDKLTLLLPEKYASFGWWVEQLVAESLGKSGRGVVPVPTTQPETGPDRLDAQLEFGDVVDLGAAFMTWCVATAAAAHVLGVDPFNEPDVAAAKAATADVLSGPAVPVAADCSLADLETTVQAMVRPGDYVALLMYVPSHQVEAAERLRRRVRDALGGLAVTAGFGPRYLHSTGQLHKGGPDSVVAVQIVDPVSAGRERRGPSVPDRHYGFDTLIAAQATGDYRTLKERGRRVVRVELTESQLP